MLSSLTNQANELIGKLQSVPILLLPKSQDLNPRNPQGIRRGMIRLRKTNPLLPQSRANFLNDLFRVITICYQRTDVRLESSFDLHQSPIKIGLVQESQVQDVTDIKQASGPHSILNPIATPK